jgi:hypothetical protein
MLTEAGGELADACIVRLSPALGVGGSPGPGGPSLRDLALPSGFLALVIGLGSSECALGRLI